MSIGPLYESYSSAIALNNIGVSLLQRQCYPEAVDTFESAVKFMQIVSRTVPMLERSLKDSPPALGAGFAASTLHRAHQRLANLKPGKQVSTKSSLSMQLSLRVLTYGETQEDSLRGFILGDSNRTCHYHIKSATSVLAIRIEHGLNPVDQEDFQSLVEVESCIMLYNFAVAYSFVASVADSAHNGQQLLDVAFKLAVLACSLVQSLRRQLEQRLASTLIGEDLLPLSIAMHTTLRGLASACVSESESLAYEAFVSGLIHEFLVKELTLIQQTHIKSAAAA